MAEQSREHFIDQPLIVTLDGPAGSGKTTVAKMVAARLGIAYLDTGAMFRAFALHLGPQSWTRSEADLRNGLAGLGFAVKGRGEESALLLNGEPLGAEIRQEEVGMWASNLARLDVVREILKQAQQRLGAETPLVAEGRDMGSVVFPQAKFKFFLEAAPEERARRRWLQLKEMGVEEDLDALAENLRRRDDQDRNRTIAPLKPAADAVIIDTAGLTPEAVAERIVQIVARLPAADA
ncbi:cytidylate kinase [Desulfonatronum thiosulfatophilum]|uniref:Cytidylate kinase n=1 Tax=Desulfonatronum thiosulfatophilum TaxID=617002 RepID=A0A1G6ED39_9BACT|nr:(d)CMP kinase [Desulfonatronum thiosulfatophilum]SDB55258.1 cytidylate kinase [Desulfonatronum thiosulfatophilum]